MSATWGTNIELSLFGESHGEAIGIVIGHLPAGIELDEEFIRSEMDRRIPGKKLTTTRKEDDEYHIISGVLNNKTTGAPLCMIIKNKDHHSQDYSLLKDIMRPSHSDYGAYVKYNGLNDIRGGGHFSGRLTAPIVFAGAIAKIILKQKGIEIKSHIYNIKEIYDEHFGINIYHDNNSDTINEDVYIKMLEEVEKARNEGDSLGGSIECAILNVPAGIGNPFFDSIESHMSSLLFSIPAVKSVNFTLSDDVTSLKGSEFNDSYYYDQEVVKTLSNNNGGIVGGITNGMPVIVRVGFKPTPSISKIQNTVNVKTKENTTLQLKGRHDPCIVLRARAVVEAMCALSILDQMGY